jgi:cytidylate kinase
MTKRSSLGRSGKVCINGDLGSGKTTAARGLAKFLHYDFYSMGLMQRQIARRRGITTLELNRVAETDQGIDHEIDGILKMLAKGSEKIVVDSRMGWFFIPRSLKIRLVCNPQTSASRLVQDKNREAESYKDIQQAMSSLMARRDSERKRFLDLYKVSVEDLTHYDLVMQTDLYSRREIVKILVAHMRANREFSPLLILSPKLIFPLDHVRALRHLLPRAARSETSVTAKPIEVLYCDDCFFVVVGHKRLAATLSEGVNFIAARPWGGPNVEAAAFLRNEVSLTRIYDWEDALNFKFAFYPLALFR